MNPDSKSLWVFGYGSLCWLPGFEYGDSVLGHIDGFARRFWQGNTTHRGTEEKPGRVATLIEDKAEKTHGIAFQLLGEAALQYLQTRECTLGGYVTVLHTFYPKDKSKPSFPVLLYMATPSNRHWMGPAPLSQIAEQVVGCAGPSGHNVEYVLRLAEWCRKTLPDIHDDHLFTLESHIRFKIKENNLCMKGLLRECEGECQVQQQEAGVAGAVGGADADGERTNSFTFTSKMGRSKLRCLNA